MPLLNRLEPVLSQLEASVNFEGLWSALDRQNQICMISNFLTFPPKFLIFIFFPKLLSKFNQKGLRPNLFSKM